MGLSKALDQVPDHRSRRGRSHSLSAIRPCAATLPGSRKLSPFRASLLTPTNEKTLVDCRLPLVWSNE